MNKVVHMEYSSTLSSLCEVNPSFDTGVLRIAYHGKNRNGSHISKEAFESSIATLYNCPIVCHYDRENDAIGGHDMELVRNDNGDMRLVNTTVPVGVVPESAKHFWSVVTEEDGTEREYLCADVLIWKRQEAYRKIREDGIVSQSMEITVRDGEMEDGVFVIKAFEFTALCLLGDEHEPCFESSALSMFSLGELKAQMAQMMSDLKKEFSLISPPAGVDDTHLHNHTTEGGEKVLDEKIALVAEYGFEVDALDFSIKDMTVEELREKFETMKSGEHVADTHADSEDPKIDFALASQIREELHIVLSEEKVECSWGEMTRYRYVDHDHEAMEVYCYDATDWKLYGFSYSMNGDNVVIDYDSKKRMKFAIVDFDEGEQAAPFAGVFEEISKQYAANDTQWSERYQTASDTITSMTDELCALRQFKTETEEAANEAARAEVFAQFEDLVGVEEFESLRENAADFGLEALEEKCYAIRGRNGATAKFSHEPKAPKFMVVKTAPVNEPYGGLFIKYNQGDA